MGKTDIEYSTRAVDQLENLETEIADRITSKLDDVAWNPEHYLKGRKMTNSPHYSLVVGDYRVIIDWRRNETPEVLFIRRVGHRRNVYIIQGRVPRGLSPRVNARFGRNRLG